MPRRPQDLFSELQQQFGQFVPDMARAAREDVEQHARAAVMSVLARLDLVTREEFDAQAAVLQRTREKLEALEKRVSTLEVAVQDSQGQESEPGERES
jgi:BMFP domain-containing protein YqiC